MNHVHGGDLVTYRQSYPDVPVLDFSANINPLGMAEGVKRALAGCGEACLSYPDPHCRELRTALSFHEEVPADWILCGNGASDLINRMAWALRPQSALLLSPTFADYERALAAAGCRMNYALLQEEDSFDLPRDFEESIAGNHLVFLCNPNNPTGRLIGPDRLKRILDRCRREGAILAVDECFLDFLPDDSHSLKRYLRDAKHLIILRAFTKIFAIPGLRLGYALCADRELLHRLELAGPTWSVSAPAQLCGIAATGERDYLEQTRLLVPKWRAQLAAGLEERGCKVIEGAANYLFFRARPGLVAQLAPFGILLRDCANYRGLDQGWYRAAVRTEAENRTLLDAMDSVQLGRGLPG